MLKDIVFHDAIAGRQAEAAETKLEGFCTVAGLRQKIGKIIMVNPEPLGYLAARATHGNKAAKGIFMPEGIIIHLVIIAIEQEVFALTGALKQVLRPAAKAGTGSHIDLRGTAGKCKPFDNDISRGVGYLDTRRSVDFGAPDGLCGDGDGLCDGALLIDGNIRYCGINAIGQNDDISGGGAVDGFLQGGERRYVDGSCIKRAGEQQAKTYKKQAATKAVDVIL